MRVSLTAAMLSGLAAALPALAGTPDVDVIFSRVGTSPTAVVPGAVDAAGLPVITQFAGMSAFYLGPDGSTWLLQGTTTQPSTESAIMLGGSGLTGSMLLQDGQPFPGAVGGEIVDFFSSTTNPINDNGDRLVVLRARGGSTAVQHKMIRFTSMGGSLVHQSGDLYTGIIDSPPGNSGDELLGNSLQSGVLLNDGTIGWRDDTVVNCHSSRRPVTAFNAVKHLQEGDTVTNIDGETLSTLQNIGSTGTITVLAASPDGSRIVVRGNIIEGEETPQVVIVDGEVRIQSGHPIGEGEFLVTDIHATAVAGNGDWYARGVYDGGSWAARNGSVLVASGDSIGDDAWAAATFFSINGNSSGDWVIAGKTTNPDTATDDVIAVNGEVVLREGDPVVFDIDGDNQADDTAYIGRGNNTIAAFIANSVYLAPDGAVYALVNLRDEFGADLGGATALVRIQTGNCPADYDGNDLVEVLDIFAFLTDWFANVPAAYEFGGTPGVPAIFAFLTAWFAGCP